MKVRTMMQISNRFVKWFLPFYLFTFLPLNVSAQQRMPCTHARQGATTRGYYYALPDPKTNWDSHQTYRQPVVLITFKDCDFSMSDPVGYYRRLFNEEGYNEGMGKGCVADYFREQSDGLCNIQFDIYGPIQVDTIAKQGSGTNYGTWVISQALRKLRETSDADFSVYDWDGNGKKVSQMIFIAAGYTGNEKSGYIWPNTGESYDKAPGNLPIDWESISCERWGNGSLCGIGTIIHEFSHCLGLPDIYPTSGNLFSVVDEWDLMDGGNYTNYGWCPPNYSALEKMVLGWNQPTELTAFKSIKGMKPVSEGGETFIIRNPGYEREFYLLENRRQTGWDYGTPGNGLLIFHVDYDYAQWCYNNVNVSKDHLRYALIPADNKTYTDWDPANNGKDPNKWTMADRLRNRYMSTATYPFTDPVSLVVNLSLTNETVPASTLFNVNTDGTTYMSKPITNIQVASDGSVSFDFMKEPSAITDAVCHESDDNGPWYDLQGRRLSTKPTRKGVYVHDFRKIVIK